MEFLEKPRTDIRFVLHTKALFVAQIHRIYWFGKLHKQRLKNESFTSIE